VQPYCAPQRDLSLPHLGEERPVCSIAAGLNWSDVRQTQSLVSASDRAGCSIGGLRFSLKLSPAGLAVQRRSGEQAMEMTASSP
jgi:hypothetical protein